MSSLKIYNGIEWVTIPQQGSASWVIDQSGGTSDTYGVLAGSIDGVNTTFTVSTGKYVSGTLKVYLNGQLMTQGSAEDWVETVPTSGTFDFNTAPQVGDEITVCYYSANSTLGNAALVGGYAPTAFVKKSEFTSWDKITEGTYDIDLTDGLVSYWKMDDNAANTTVVDSHGANNGTLTGAGNTSASSVAGKIGKALTFDGVNDYVACGTPYVIGVSPVSYSLWFKTSYVGGQQIFLSSNADYTDNFIKLYMGTTVATDGKIWIYSEGNSNAQEFGNGGTNIKSTIYSYADNLWHHLVVTRDGAKGKIYIDGGAEIVDVLIRADSICNAGDETRIGTSGGGALSFNGQLDEVGIWNKALTLDEIELLYNSTAGRAYEDFADTLNTLDISENTDVDGYVIADDFITKSRVADIKDNQSSLSKLDNMGEWLKGGKIQYDKHYAHTEVGSKKGLSMETRVAEMEKMIYELNKKLGDKI